MYCTFTLTQTCLILRYTYSTHRIPEQKPKYKGADRIATECPEAAVVHQTSGTIVLCNKLCVSTKEEILLTPLP